jgi:predicted acylesterase/phospholipase RssA
MLALDGGGIRGIITLQVLLELESRLRERSNRGDDFRLCDFFDYVAGTSTGAIIAAAIARGLTVGQVISFYEDFGRSVFQKRRWGVWESLYSDGALVRKLKEVYGERTTLHPRDLKTLLLPVVRNATTDSVWPISSNPAALYNDTSRADCNLHIPLWQLVRASTAAPVFFPPEVLEWEAGDPDKAFVFVDGGTTAYNNPAFLLARMATAPEYRLGWAKGEDKLLIVSVGTGAAPAAGNEADDPHTNLISSAAQTLKALMSQAAYDQDVNCRSVGRCVHGRPLDREVGDMIPRDTRGEPVPLSDDLGRAFLYVRYDADLTRNGLDAKGLHDIDASAVCKLDAVENIPDLTRVGQALADEVSLDHLGHFAEMES